MAATREQIKQLAKEIPYKWKPQSVKFGKATMVGYVDARDIQNLFDEAVGPENWQVNYSIVDKQMFATIGVRVKHEDGTVEWIWKSDGGTESNVEQEKGLISDCFKRAAVTWSAGRFLYDLDIVELKTAMYKDKEKPATDDGKILWSNDEISDYIRNRKNKVEAPQAPAGKDPKKYETPTKEPTYTKAACNEDTMKKVAALDKNGSKGKDCIKKYLQDFNTSKKTDYKLADLNTDERLIAIVDFINSIPPKI